MSAKDHLDTLIVGLAFGATTVILYASLVRVDEAIYQNRLFSTSVAGVTLAACIAGMIVHVVSSYAYRGAIRWAHCEQSAL